VGAFGARSRLLTRVLSGSPDATGAAAGGGVDPGVGPVECVGEVEGVPEAPGVTVEGAFELRLSPMVPLGSAGIAPV